MLRDPSLIPLSHQHHNGLALCVMTRRSLAADSSPENMAKLARRAIDRYELELQSMHCSSRSHAERRAQGANRFSTIAAARIYYDYNSPGRGLKSSGSVHCASAQKDAESRRQPGWAAPQMPSALR